MNAIPSRLLLSASTLLLLAGSTTAQRSAKVRDIEIPGKDSVIRVWNEGGTPFYSISLDGKPFHEPTETSYDLLLRFEQFDPAKKVADVPANLVAGQGNRLFVVQYWSQGIEDMREVIRENGGEIHRFLANNANIVEMDRADAAAVAKLPFVRSVSPYHPAFKLDEELRAGMLAEQSGEILVNILSTRRGGFSDIAPWIEQNGGTISETNANSYRFVASIESSLLPDLAALNQVAWIDPQNVLPREEWSDMDIAREFHGTNFVLAAGNYRGQNVRIEDRDTGVDTTHQDLQDHILHGANSSSTHGTATSGIVLGKGLGNPAAMGCMPDAFLVIRDINTAIPGGSRYAEIGQLEDPSGPYRCVLQTNSVSFTRTLQYNSVSQDVDNILFDYSRFNMCQSQSNANNQQSRPEAWAKNIIAVGGINHLGTLTKTDDRWGGASIGPAADGRIKPDLASFYDRILTTTSVNRYTTGFGGTSGATPIIAGNLGLFVQMWHDGVFGNATTGADPFESRPQNTTTKAVMINTASQWTFSGTSHNLTRVHQGWGHADLQYMWQNRNNMLIVDESDVLGLFDATTYYVNCDGSEPEFRATMVYRDLPGTTSSSLHRINNLDLYVIAPDGTIYKGNRGLDANNYSLPGGRSNGVDTVEQVLLQNPAAGEWRVMVYAAEINGDSHVETGAVDADYALVVSGIDSIGPQCATAIAAPRLAGPNPNVLTATAPVIGQNVTFNFNTQGMSFGQVIGTVLPERRLTDSGYFALVQPETQVFATPRIPGPNGSVQVLVANDPAMCGMTIYCQARLDDGPRTPFILTNGVDLKVGN